VHQRWARPWFAATFVIVVVELVITCVNAADNTDGHFHTAGARVFNVFWYFTIQSNVLVGITCLLLALHLGRTSTVFAVFRLMGVVAITVTFIVFHVALSHLLDLDTWEQVANQLQHTVVPIVAVAGWLLFGPRRLTSARIAGWTVLFPVVYIIATAIRGPLVRDWYPYPFADVAAHGYVRVILNGVVIALFFWAVAAGATWVDRRLPDRSDAPTPSRG
jgi:hypothetical protein